MLPWRYQLQLWQEVVGSGRCVPLLKTFEECVLLGYLRFLVICELESGLSIEEDGTGVELCVEHSLCVSDISWHQLTLCFPKCFFRDDMFLL